MSGRFKGASPKTRHSSGMFNISDALPMIAAIDNLLCFWDTEDRVSHNDGSEWVYDLSGNDKDAFGVQTYSITQRADGFMDFASATGPIQVTPPVTTAITDVTLQVVVDIPSTSEAAYLIGVGTGANGYFLSVANNAITTAGNHLLALFGGVRWVDTNYALGTGKMLLTMILDGSSVPSFYKNTTSIPGSYGGSAPTTPTSVNLMGFASPNGLPTAAGLFYSKQLSASEISQNYDIFSSRW